ncbi:BCNT-domain-containing protein [Massarina eburnea CBS 473.64]|uniref:SWR1-complex protein 5 n=1 Tax=Massarina eburnea CBS 473.64 TaxID=1395130 RepID=A0A6A6S7N6_9PLEO|nr:BCNT-domain-containing protein [Massarina eburnea CBS 473.64]
MAPIDPIDDLPDADDGHDSSDDDFNPTNAPAEDSPSSSDEDAPAPAPARPVKGRRKRKAPVEDELDSGDEVTIQAARKRKAKKRKGAQDEDEDLLLSDIEGGEGGLIKTRAQRRDEIKERKPLARTEGATIDVDALWAQMLAAPLKPLAHIQTLHADTGDKQETTTGAVPSAVVEEEEQVTIKKVYSFAGQDTTEEKQVPRSLLSKFLTDGWKAADATTEKAVADDEAEVKDEGPQTRRPLRRPSRYDPNPTGFVRALPPEHQLAWPRKAIDATATGQENAPAPDGPKTARPEKAQKLNVVDKSRLDWTGFVDKEGIAEELDTHGKTKEAYLGRMNFLAGVEAKQEEERKRMKTAAVTT